MNIDGYGIHKLANGFCDCGERKKDRWGKMDKLLSIALWILIPIVVLLAICGTSIVVALWLHVFFGVDVFGLT